MDLRQFGPHCWGYPGDLTQVRPWIGAIVTPTTTLLVDAANSPEHAREIQEALDEIGAPPVSLLLVTHHHWDHHFGACAFPDARVLAHVETQKHLAVMATEPWSAGYLTLIAAQDPGYAPVAKVIQAAIPDFTDFDVRTANETFTGEWRWEGDGVTVRFVHVGGPHEPDCCVAHVLPDNVLYVSDAPYGRGSRKRWDWAGIAAMYRRLAEFNATLYVEGHRAPQDHAEILARAAEIEARLV